MTALAPPPLSAVLIAYHQADPIGPVIANRRGLAAEVHALTESLITVGRSPSHVSRSCRIADMDAATFETLRRKASAFSVARELADPDLAGAQRMDAIAHTGRK